MIKKIGDISKTDAFESFSWSAPEFKRYNLVYGWNGSGKTTLSRTLSFLERRAIHLPDLANIEFTVECSTGTLKRSALETHGQNIRVFNEDFVRTNLVFEQGRAKKIVIVGKESIELQTAIESLEKERKAKADDLAVVDRKLPNAAQYVQALTDAGREVTKQFGNTPLANHAYYGRSYNKTRVESLLSNSSITADNVATLELSQEALDQSREIVKKEWKTVSLVLDSVSDFSTLFETANTLLNTEVNVARSSRLDGDDILREWTETGFRLHRHRAASSCLFCDSPLNANLLAGLSLYFTEQLAQVKESIASSLDLLEKLPDTAKRLTLDSALLYPDLAVKYAEKRADIELHSTEILLAVSQTINSLKSKSVSIHTGEGSFSTVAYPADAIDKVNQKVDAVIGLVEDHNRRVSVNTEEVSKAAKAIEFHTIASALIKFDYFRRAAFHTELTAKRKLLANELKTFDDSLLEKKNAINNTTLAVERINQLLEDFFGKSRLYLVPTGSGVIDAGYVLMSRGKPAKLLSEGEKSVLALIYFFVKLEEAECDRSTCTVVIDDPVDSQDAVFLFRTYGVLKRELADVAQVIVFTHNFDFFNLVRDWFTLRPNRKHSEQFLIGMASTDTGRACTLQSLPRSLQDFKSEYQFLFARLYQFAQHKDGLEAPLVANVARKVLEYFAGFKWSSKTSSHFATIVSDKYVDSNDRRLHAIGDFIYKFVNEYSHGNDFSRSAAASDFEAVDIAQNVVALIENADPDHYKALTEMIDAQQDVN